MPDEPLFAATAPGDVAPGPLCAECGVEPVKAAGKRCRRCVGRANLKGATGNRGPGRPRNIDKLRDNIETAYASLGTAVYMWCDVCGQTIIIGAPELAASLCTWAEENPKVRATLEKAFEKTALALVLAAHAKIALAIAGHHGLSPAAILGGGNGSEPVDPGPMNGHGAHVN